MSVITPLEREPGRELYIRCGSTQPGVVIDSCLALFEFWSAV